MSKAKKIVLVFLSILTVSTLVLSVPVSAASPTVYTMQYQKPGTNDYSGYFEALSNNGEVYVGFWQITCRLSSSNDITSIPIVDIYQYNKDWLGMRISFPHNSTDLVDFYAIYGFYRSTDNSKWINSSTYTEKPTLFAIPNAFWVPGGVKDIRLYGNTNSSLDYTSNTNWVVTYGSDTALYYQMEGMKEAFNSFSGSISGSINSNADKNASQIQSNADKNASETQTNDNKNTQAIIDNQNDLAEKEKNETQSQGEGSVNDVSGAIEDKSAGFVSSIGNLVSAMSYNGTSCAWNFPALKLPSIEGVIPEIQLTEEQPIDFEYWVNKIPSNILLLVRSVLTIALIVYCFKELYNTISYVLTLKGGGNNE